MGVDNSLRVLFFVVPAIRAFEVCGDNEIQEVLKALLRFSVGAVYMLLSC